VVQPISNIRSQPFIAGGASFDITPPKEAFLYGYPHEPRISMGVNDPLLASALYLDDGTTAVLFVQVDLIWLPKGLVAEARAQIASRTGVAGEHIMVTASHTHSGPVTLKMISNADDPVVPPPDPDYLALVRQGIIAAAEQAKKTAVTAEVSVVSAFCNTIGSNRLDTNGPRMTDVPVLAVRSAIDPNRWLGLMFVNPVHPTVLHSDSKIVSGDFPAMCREFLQANMLGKSCPVLCHLGAAGNQSPRYVVRDHSIDEARRLGESLGAAIVGALCKAAFASDVSLSVDSTAVELSARQLPSVDQAAAALREAREELARLRKSDALAPVIRTAECAVFGAEESLTLARAGAEGKIAAAIQDCLPAEIQVIGVGKWKFVGWPGEVFVEFALRLRERHNDAVAITLANGELQGYLVTAAAVRQQCYEASNAIFASPESGERLVAATTELIEKNRHPASIASSAF
jgi:neutral ceramidase